MKPKLLLLTLIALCPEFIFAQTVSTLLTNANADNLTLDLQGNIYASGYNTGEINKITPNGVASVYANITVGLAGSVFDTQGNLFVANYNNGNIYKILSDGSYTIFVNLGTTSGPAGLAINSAGDIFAACSGTATSPLSIIKKITSSGAVNNFSTGTFSNYFAPGGLTFDTNDNLYVSNYANANICKITPTGTISVFTTIPGASGSSFVAYLTFNNGFIYVCHAGGNKIYKVDLAGNRTLYSGTGSASSNDGSTATATFNMPNGIVATNSGDKIYVSEISGNNVRQITTLLGTTNFDNDIEAKVFLNGNDLSVISNNFKLGKLNIELYDMNGKKIWEKKTQNNKIIFSAKYALPNLISEGVYTVKILNEDKILSKKIIYN